MHKRKLIVSVLVVFFAAASGSLSPGWGLDPAPRCESKKLKEAGKYAFCRMKAEAKAVKKNTPADYAKCDAKFSSKWGKIETAAAGTCPVTGDALAVQGQATIDATELAATIAGIGTAVCGDGVAAAGEDCDQSDLAGETCVTQGFAGGTLSCAGGCGFDTGSCWTVRFDDNADGTITDNETGLRWMKQVAFDGAPVDCTSAALCPNPHDVDNRYTWSATLPNFDGEVSTVLLAQLNDTAGGGASCLAGFCDWRLATRSELASINDDSTLAPSTFSAFHGTSCGPGCTDVTDPACSCTNTAPLPLYWSSSDYASNPNFAWTVEFDDGAVAFTNKTSSHYARAVRGSP